MTAKINAALAPFEALQQTLYLADHGTTDGVYPGDIATMLEVFIERARAILETPHPREVESKKGLASEREKLSLSQQTGQEVAA